MGLTIAEQVLMDWTAVAASAIVESPTLDCSSNYKTSLLLQAGLTNTTAHDGTLFKLQISYSASGDEDWADFLSFVDLVGTAEQATLSVLAAAEDTSVAITGGPQPDSVIGNFALLKDSADIANSELLLVTEVATSTTTFLDGLTNGHAVSSPISSIAISRTIALPDANVLRARIVINNNYDSSPATLQCKLTAVKTTGI